jgi:AcrR family transcriptional regulator
MFSFPRKPPPGRGSLRHAHNYLARVRALYEDSLVTVPEIARLAGVTERMIYHYARDFGWTPRAARLAAQREGRAGKLSEGAAAAVAAAEARAARLRAERDAQTQTRTFELLAGALVELAELSLSPPVEFGSRPGSTAAARASADRAARLAQRLTRAILKRLDVPSPFSHGRPRIRFIAASR